MTKTLKTNTELSKPKEQKGEITNGSRPTHNLNVKTTQFGGKEVNYRIALLWDNEDYINIRFPKLVVVNNNETGVPTLYAEVKHYGQPARVELARFERIKDEVRAFEGNYNDMVIFKRKDLEEIKTPKGSTTQPKP